MRFWINLVGYQLVWFVAVTAVARGAPWLAVAAPLLFAGTQWIASAQRLNDARLVACALLLGIAVDGLLAASAWLTYASPTPALAAPLWILSIWIAFAMTINHSLTALRARPALAAALGAIGGPLAYGGAARGFDAVRFAPPAWHAMAALAVGWALSMWVLASLARHWDRPANMFGNAETAS